MTTMEIGKKIKALRTQKSLTQEALASELSVSPQAISKWECGSALPDIQLLPQIAILFGITLDELFCLTDDNELDRIQNMIWDRRLLPQGEMDRAERFLQAKIAGDFRPARCLCLLAQLHNHQAQQHRLLAEDCAKRSLAINPAEKDAHSELCAAAGGYIPDWPARNHHKLIAFYEDFLTRNPDEPRSYLWLLDNLIADHRLKEADTWLKKMARVDSTYRVPLYRGLILRAAGREPEARRCWEEMAEQFPGEWLVSLSLGDLAAEREEYDEAVRCYRRALTQQAPPRLTDSYDAIAHICEIRGDISGAIGAYKEELEIFRSEWGFTEGETADCIHREIRRLEGLLP